MNLQQRNELTCEQAEDLKTTIGNFQNKLKSIDRELDKCIVERRRINSKLNTACKKFEKDCVYLWRDIAPHCDPLKQILEGKIRTLIHFQLLNSHPNSDNTICQFIIDHRDLGLRKFFKGKGAWKTTITTLRNGTGHTSVKVHWKSENDSVKELDCLKTIPQKICDYIDLYVEAKKGTETCNINENSTNDLNSSNSIVSRSDSPMTNHHDGGSGSVGKVRGRNRRVRVKAKTTNHVAQKNVRDHNSDTSPANDEMEVDSFEDSSQDTTGQPSVTMDNSQPEPEMVTAGTDISREEHSHGSDAHLVQLINKCIATQMKGLNTQLVDINKKLNNFESRIKTLEKSRHTG